MNEQEAKEQAAELDDCGNHTPTATGGEIKCENCGNVLVIYD